MSLMEKKAKTIMEKDNSQKSKRKNGRTTLNLLILMTFVLQLILPIGLHVNAMGEGEEAVEAVTAQVQEVEDLEEAEEAKNAEEEAEKQAQVEKEAAKKAEEEAVRKAEEAAEKQAQAEKEAEAEARKAEEEAARKAEEDKKTQETQEKESIEEKKEDESSPSKTDEVDDGTEEVEEEVIESEELEEDEEDEEELLENIPAMFTPAIPIPAMGKMKLSGGLVDTIEVNKTATRTPGCRTFEVKLDITGERQDAPVDVVLVIDRSGSMNDKAGGTILNPLSRLYYAKLAAVNFAGRVLGPNGIPGSRVSLVTFNGPSQFNVIGSISNSTINEDLTSNLTTITNKINAITAEYGTNTQAGFQRGQEVIQGTKSLQNPNSNKVVIMFTDGMPTASDRAGAGPNAPTSHNNHTRAAYEAGQAIYQNNIADVFTIGLLQGMSGTVKNVAVETLTWAQNKGFYEAPTAQDLDDIFADISTQLGYSATQAKVVDKIGDNFDLIESSLPAGANYNAATREITWNPGTIVDAASLTYKVVAKPDFPGGLANTNEYAKLTYTDIFGTPNKTKNFTVDDVDVPTLIEVNLTDASINLGDSISLGNGTEATGENYMSPVTGGDNDGETFTYEWRKVGDDTVISTDKNPSVSPTEDTEYEVRVTDSNGCIAVATMTVRVNKKIGKISISKIIKDLDDIMDLTFFGDVNPEIFKEIEFDIKVSGPENYENIIKLKDGQTKTIEELAFGQYTIEEIYIDDHFLLDNIDPKSFELTKDNQWVEVEVVNKVNYANFEFTKVNEEGNSLAGIEFELSKDGVTQTVTTVANEKVSFNFLEEGEYVLKETKTIAGFRLPTETWIIEVVRNVTTGQLEVIIPDDSFIIGEEEGYEIENKKQNVFPQTGGVGGLSYIAVGLTIFTTSLGIFVKKEEN